ncbi:thioredoxin family protein [Pseudovibrio sp. Tun.PSC04-5.I4]|uniref:SoxW family protein n=1 Tax=Pseudovibrio sp. Tun.PSC04-5.I4 TaxID=1798213 RepID=UPI0008868909|nr:thioredoxin family protein [Pseudovibrio sp. Tun.PSC04-5.I4]SDQ75986.1 Thioredoxin-related protein [Pseudovibrio sp. Tun.PSC04-5.I4]
MLKRIFFAVAMIFASMTTSFAEVGEDGLHKQPWLRLTFKDLREDLALANEEGKRMIILFEQRGCIYCARLHKNVFSDPDVKAFIEENYFVVQMNLFGDEEVTDFDGEVQSEKNIARRWGVVFTPTFLFLPEEVEDGGTAGSASVQTMPGAFGKWTTLNMLRWIKQKGYEGDEHFQKFHAREFLKQQAASK